MKFLVKNDTASFTNKAYDGVCLHSGASYNFTMWIRNPDYEGKITISCKTEDGTTTAITKEIKITKSKEWQKIENSFTAKTTIKNGTFILTQSKGTVDYG